MGMVTKFLDWVAEYRKLVKAFGLVLIWIAALLFGALLTKWVVTAIVTALGSSIVFWKVCDLFLNWWKDKRSGEKAKQRHEEQITAINMVTETVVSIRQDVLERLDQLETKLAQPTQKEIRELPISQASRETLYRVAELSAKGDAEAVLRELADDSTVREEIEALAINMAYRYFYRGVAYIELGKWIDAVESFDFAVKYKSNFIEAWYNRGIILGRNLNQNEEAVKSFDESIKYKCDYTEAWNNRGIALSKLNRVEDSLHSYDMAIKCNPDHFKAWYNRGIALGNLRCYEDEIKSYDETIKLTPHYAEAWFNRGVALANLYRHEEAVQCFDKTIQLNSSDPEAWYNRGVALANLYRHEEAVQCFDKTIQLNSSDPEAWYNRGTEMCQLDKFEEAIHDFDKAMLLDATFVNAIYNKGIALLAMKQYAEAITCLQRVLDTTSVDWTHRKSAEQNITVAQKLLIESND